jgi:hypothetical protein
MLAVYTNNYSNFWGGVDVMVARFAHRLQENKVSYCVIVPDGAKLRKHLPDGTKVISHDSIEEIAKQITHVFLPSTSYLFTPEIPWSAFTNATLYTWVVHPSAPFHQSFPFSGRLLNYVGYRGVPLVRTLFKSHAAAVNNLFSLLVARGSIAVMDGATLRALNYFFPNLPTSPAVVPIPSPTSVQTDRVFESQGEISMAYLGRLDREKWSAIAPFLLNDVAKIARSRSVMLHAITDENNYVDKLRVVCQEINVNLRHHGFMSNEASRTLIKTSTHFAFAMGTSALDIAGSGHPCLVVDPALGSWVAPQQLFRFVHEAEHFTTGEHRDFPGYVSGIRTLSESMELVTRNDLGRAGRIYVEQHHSPAKCFETLLSGILGAEATVSEVGRMALDVRESFQATKTLGMSSARKLLISR